jgi:esterase/lipase superfamily enzyme
VPVDVFYATDRAREGDGYSGHPNATHRVALGRATISIPANHRRGSLERPFSLFRKELFAEDPQKHVVIHAGPTEMEEAAYYAAVREAIANSTQRDAFVFVHGYNVSFADALRRTGQLAYDVGWKGAPILYSWPSRGELMGYTSDEQIVDYSAPHLADFLTQLREHAAMERLHLIAHSMGSRVLTKALDRIHLAGGKAALQAFQEVIIAAPDLNLHVFSELAGALRETSRHVTIYSSTRDLALRISSALHGEAARVGSGQDLPARARGFDLIDAANVDTSFLGHSYFVEQPALLEDLRDVLLYGKPAAERAGRLRPAGLIWEFF